MLFWPRCCAKPDAATPETKLGDGEMYELYIGNKNYSSWSLRPWVLMWELDIPFRETLVPFTPDRHDEYLKFSPSGKVPCLDDHGTIVWDPRHHRIPRRALWPVWPLDPEARASRCAAAEMHSGLLRCATSACMNWWRPGRAERETPALLADVARITLNSGAMASAASAAPSSPARLSPRPTPSSARSPSAPGPMAC